MISSLGGLADRAFLIGYLTPVLVFLIAGLGVFREAPGVLAVWSALLDKKTFEDLTLVAAGVWFAAMLLMLLNRLIYRALEGYWGPLKRPTVTARLIAEYKRTERWLDVLDRRAEETDAAGQATRAATRANRLYNRKQLRLCQQFPPFARRVLPTRFGNINRAFESYGRCAYGVDLVAVWPRLLLMMGKETQTALAEARAQVDAFVNIWLLGLALAGGAALYGVARLGGVASAAWIGESSLGALAALTLRAAEPFAWGLAAAGASRAAYQGACERAVALGEVVKAATDLTLPGLPAQMGYVAPEDPEERKRFWSALETTFLAQARAPAGWRHAPAQPAPSLVERLFGPHQPHKDAGDQKKTRAGEGAG